MSAVPVLALTPGEPAGIGPDLAVLLAQHPPPCALVVIADTDLLAARARQLGVALRIREYRPDAALSPSRPGELYVQPVPLATETRCGSPDPANAEYVLETLRQACNGCLAGRFAAMVTGPVQKSVLRAAGVPFTGHTEFLADICKVPTPVMLMVGGGLRIAFATTHLPLAQVPTVLNAPYLEAMLKVLVEGLRQRLGIQQPSIRVLGLNPHAGESGWLGAEEQQVITPVLERLRRHGMRLEGPCAADTAFIDLVPHATDTPPASVDAVLAMYHDQALPVIKTLAFTETVNVTLGLPFLRTSVDHGTAVELAGTGRARPDSLYAAIRLALAYAPGRAAHLAAAGG